VLLFVDTNTMFFFIVSTERIFQATDSYFSRLTRGMAKYTLLILLHKMQVGKSSPYFFTSVVGIRPYSQLVGLDLARAQQADRVGLNIASFFDPFARILITGAQYHHP
jgi:hypothetical protein